MHTTLKNTAGVARIFSFIPPHGRELADDATVEILGEVIPQISTKRAREAYEDAVKTGELTIVHTPAVLILDDTTAATKQLILDSGSLAVDDPRLPSL